MSKHTKGPWEAAERGAYSDYDGDSVVILGDDMRIAVVQHSGAAWQTANARLMVAAPDMLEALENAALQIEYLHDKFGETGTGMSVLFQVRAAIAKATGATGTSEKGEK
jgi:hypothetical protein